MEQDACIATKSVSFRFHLLLSAKEIKRAKNHLNQIWRALKNANAIKTLATETVDTVETDIPIVAEMNKTENTETDELEEKELKKETTRIEQTTCRAHYRTNHCRFF